MANKKAKIDKSALPLVNSDNKYYVRYRIVLDKTKDSDWSDVIPIDNRPVVLVTGVLDIITVAGKKVINVVWEGTNLSPTYDIFVKWDAESYVYHGSSVSTSYSVIIPDGKTEVDLLVQAGSAQRTISNAVKVFQDSRTI